MSVRSDVSVGCSFASVIQSYWHLHWREDRIGQHGTLKLPRPIISVKFASPNHIRYVWIRMWFESIGSNHHPDLDSGWPPLDQLPTTIQASLQLPEVEGSSSGPRRERLTSELFLSGLKIQFWSSHFSTFNDILNTTFKSLSDQPDPGWRCCPLATTAGRIAPDASSLGGKPTA